MKKLFYVLLLFGSVLYIGACSSSQNVNKSDKSTGSEPPYARYDNLADVLRIQGGLIVTGSGDNVKVTIRGETSLVLDNRPLYVVNNIQLGRDYAMANSAINTADIVSIKVLRSFHELTSYGELGRNGVIKIKTRTYNQ